MAVKNVELRIIRSNEPGVLNGLGVIPTTLHAAPNDKIRWCVTTPEKTASTREKTASTTSPESFKRHAEAAIVITFPGGTPFHEVQLFSNNEGIATADVRPNEDDVRGIYHYTVAAAVVEENRARIAAITGCPEIIIQK
jgi:hypothetical protein